jgi:hypothetical protein
VLGAASFAALAMPLAVSAEDNQITLPEIKVIANTPLAAASSRRPPGRKDQAVAPKLNPAAPRLLRNVRLLPRRAAWQPARETVAVCSTTNIELGAWQRLSVVRSLSRMERHGRA